VVVNRAGTRFSQEAISIVLLPLRILREKAVFGSRKANKKRHTREGF
jgi:hypothetical protein